jgi:hypothetical protein
MNVLSSLQSAVVHVVISIRPVGGHTVIGKRDKQIVVTSSEAYACDQNHTGHAPERSCVDRRAADSMDSTASLT